MQGAEHSYVLSVQILLNRCGSSALQRSTEQHLAGSGPMLRKSVTTQKPVSPYLKHPDSSLSETNFTYSLSFPTF